MGSRCPTQGYSAGAKLNDLLQLLMGIGSLGAHYSYSEIKTPETHGVQMLGPQRHFGPNVDTAIIHCLHSHPFCTQSAVMCAKQPE